MCALKLTVLATVALACCVCARPEESNAIPDASSKEQAIATNEAEVQKPVHERFPHAVLFGGTCGGSIISATWVITAAHCTLFTNGRYVLAGTNNSLDDSGVRVRVKRTVIHPRFSVGPYWLDAEAFKIKQVAARWDFLLVELNDPLPLNGVTVAAVKLNDEASIPEGLDVGYAGYGAEHHGETMRHEMHGMELVTVANDVCREKLEQFDAEDMLCVKGRPPRYDSACNGDSGSGLVGDGRLLGVASWVENDAIECRNGALVVFSRISSVRNWIKQITGI